jgi:hypothetical protein
MDYKIITISKKELYAEGVITADECIADVPLDVIPSLMLRIKRDEVIEAYCKAYKFTPEELAEYEFGIDDWIGFGSVTCYELGGGTLVGYGYNELQMVVLG